MHRIRPVGDDLPSLLRIQYACYPSSLNENAIVMNDRLAVAADTCWMVENESAPIGYLLAYRSIIGRITPLGGAFAVAKDASCLYLHDLAILPGQRCTAAGRALIAHARQWAVTHQLTSAALVSVGGSSSYWMRNGFSVSENMSARQCAALSTYGDSACYMTQRWSLAETQDPVCR